MQLTCLQRALGLQDIVHISGIGKLIAAGNPLAVSSGIATDSSCMMQLPEAVGEYFISSVSDFFF